MILLSLLAHHSESGDPDLLDWIKDQLDAIFGLGPLLIVVVLGLVMVAIPAGILVAYLAQRRRSGAPRQ